MYQNNIEVSTANIGETTDESMKCRRIRNLPNDLAQYVTESPDNNLADLNAGLTDKIPQIT